MGKILKKRFVCFSVLKNILNKYGYVLDEINDAIVTVEFKEPFDTIKILEHAKMEAKTEIEKEEIDFFISEINKEV